MKKLVLMMIALLLVVGCGNKDLDGTEKGSSEENMFTCTKEVLNVDADNHFGASKVSVKHNYAYDTTGATVLSYNVQEVYEYSDESELQKQFKNYRDKYCEKYNNSTEITNCSYFVEGNVLTVSLSYNLEKLKADENYKEHLTSKNDRVESYKSASSDNTYSSCLELK